MLHPTDYRFCQSVGENVAVFNPSVLSDPRQVATLTYRLEDDRIVVEKRPGKKWLVLKRTRLEG